MLRISLILMIPILFSEAFGQVSEYNKLNDQGKKQGYWECFLNEKFEESSKEEATYKYFAYYQDGDKVMGKIPKWISDCELVEAGKGIKKNELILLDGEYKFRRVNKDAWTYKIVFKEGIPQSDRIDRDNSGQNYSEIFYTTKFNGIEASYYTVSESNGAYFKGYYYIDRGKMRNNVEKIKLKKSAEKRFK